VLTAANVILVLKIAVIGVTGLLLLSLLALLRGRVRLHGRINIVFFALTLSAVLGLEVVARVLEPDLFNEHFTYTGTVTNLKVHLCFSIPAALLLPVMLYTGLTRRRALHLALAAVFSVLWAGTFITGVFFLPHTR
jgi:hypothetical protein